MILKEFNVNVINSEDVVFFWVLSLFGYGAFLCRFSSPLQVEKIVGSDFPNPCCT